MVQVVVLSYLLLLTPYGINVHEQYSCENGYNGYS